MTREDRPFYWALGILGGGYVVLILLLVLANVFKLNLEGIRGFNTPEVWYAVWFSLLTSTLSAMLATIVAILIIPQRVRYAVFTAVLTI